MNFSRVQWTWDIIAGQYRRRGREINPEDNWVWSPQGVIDMHRPERWGVVIFARTESAPTEQTVRSVQAELAGRDALMEAYYRQRQFHNSRGRWAAALSELQIENSPIDLRTDREGFTASMALPASSPPRTLHVRQDSRLWSE